MTLQDNANLQGTVAKFQAQVEKLEADKQALAYQLTVTKKKANNLVKTTNHKEVSLSKEMIHLAG